MKLPIQPPTYDRNFEQQRSGIIERALIEGQTIHRTVEIAYGVPAPGPSADRAVIYVDEADGDLKVVFPNGTVKTLATD